MRDMEEQKRMEFCLLEKGQDMRESIQKSMKWAKKKESERRDWKKWELTKVLGKHTEISYPWLFGKNDISIIQACYKCNFIQVQSFLLFWILILRSAGLQARGDLLFMKHPHTH